MNRLYTRSQHTLTPLVHIYAGKIVFLYEESGLTTSILTDYHHPTLNRLILIPEKNTEDHKLLVYMKQLKILKRNYNYYHSGGEAATSAGLASATSALPKRPTSLPEPTPWQSIKQPISKGHNSEGFQERVDDLNTIKKSHNSDSSNEVWTPCTVCTMDPTW